MLKAIRKITELTKAFGLWIAGNSVEIIWCIITVICVFMSIKFYQISGEFINTFKAFFE